MTKENGKVTVAVKVPVFGLVTGTKTMEEIISGKAPETEVSPAVKTRDAGAAAAPPSPASVRTSAVAKVDPVVATPAPAAGAMPTPAPANPPAATNDEDAAAALLRMGDNYLGVGMKAKAAEKFQEVLTKYASTAAAAKAREGLAKCK